MAGAILSHQESPGRSSGQESPREKQDVRKEVEKPSENRAYVWAVASAAQALASTSSVILGTSFIPLNSGFLFCKQSIENPLLLGWVQRLNAHKHLYYAASVEDISNMEADSSGKEQTRCRWQRDGGLGKAG